MPNKIKRTGTDALGLQITKPARSAGLVEETEDGDTKYRAHVRVYSFDDILLVVDTDRVNTEHIAELVASATRDTKSIHQAINSRIQHGGHGYRVTLPPATDAGFELGDTAPAHPGPNTLIITKGDRDGKRLADDLLTIRREQTTV